jgi:hypothetical protein
MYIRKDASVILISSARMDLSLFQEPEILPSMDFGLNVDIRKRIAIVYVFALFVSKRDTYRSMSFSIFNKGTSSIEIGSIHYYTIFAGAVTGFQL